MIWLYTKQIPTPEVWNEWNWSKDKLEKSLNQFEKAQEGLESRGIDYLLMTYEMPYGNVYRIWTRISDIYLSEWLWKDIIRKNKYRFFYNDSPGTEVILDFIKVGTTQLRMEFVFPGHDNLRLVVTKREQGVRIGKSLKVRIKELVTEHLGFTEYSEYLMPQAMIDEINGRCTE